MLVSKTVIIIILNYGNCFIPSVTYIYDHLSVKRKLYKGSLFIEIFFPRGTPP